MITHLYNSRDAVQTDKNELIEINSQNIERIESELENTQSIYESVKQKITEFKEKEKEKGKVLKLPNRFELTAEFMNENWCGKEYKSFNSVNDIFIDTWESDNLTDLARLSANNVSIIPGELEPVAEQTAAENAMLKCIAKHNKLHNWKCDWTNISQDKLQFTYERYNNNKVLIYVRNCQDKPNYFYFGRGYSADILNELGEDLIKTALGVRMNNL